MPSRKQAFGVLALAGIGVAALNSVIRTAAAKREDLDLSDIHVPGRYVEIDGRRVHYVEAGSGEAVVLIHGWSASTFSMRRTIPDLAQRFRVVALDLPGYGFSSRDPKADYSTGAQASVVAGLMDHLGIERATVLGHSMGGGIAMRLAVDTPSRVERLVLVSSVTVSETRRMSFAHLFRPFMPLFAAGFLRRDIVERALRRVVHDPMLVNDDMIDGYFRPLRIKGHLRSQMKALTDRQCETQFEPEKTRQPVLLLWGEHDRVIPSSAGLALTEELPNARFAPVRSAGHLALEEQPAECNRLLLQFLDQPVHEEAAHSTNGISHESPSTVS